MAIIGTFTKLSDGTFSGGMATIAIKGLVEIKPIQKTSDKAPDYLVSTDKMDIGVAWLAISREQKKYLRVKLDDPVFPAPVHCRLIKTSNGYDLIWTR